MEKFLFEIGKPEYAGLWLCTLLGMASGLIWFASRYRDAGKWRVRTSVALSLIVDVPAFTVALSHAFRGLFDSIGFPAALVLLIGIYIGDLIVIAGYALIGLSILLAVGTLAKSGSSTAKIVSVLSNFVTCMLIGFYMHIARQPQHW